MITAGAIVDCDEPHELEVFQTLDVFGVQRDLAYPDAAELQAYAAAACSLLFDSEVVTGADKDRLAVSALVPSAALFTQRTSTGFTGRSVVCLLSGGAAGPLTDTRISDDPG
jgi:hypothetical protein